MGAAASAPVVRLAEVTASVRNLPLATCGATFTVPAETTPTWLASSVDEVTARKCGSFGRCAR